MQRRGAAVEGSATRNSSRRFDYVRNTGFPQPGVTAERVLYSVQRNEIVPI